MTSISCNPPAIVPQQTDAAHSRSTADVQTSPSWAPLTWFQRWPVIITGVILLVATVPNLPPGVCFSDSGDLQLASATLGIMHPPGYPGYVAIGYLLTRVPGVEPAYVISLASLAVGIVALLLTVLLAVRLGVNAWAAAAMVLLLTADSHLWDHLVAPEVYTPSLALLVGSSYLLVKYARLGRRRDLYWAAFLFGLVVSNRPTAFYAFPFFVLAWWYAGRQWELSGRRSARILGMAALCAALPGVFALSFLWIRDAKTTEYNYIEHNNAEVHIHPDAETGFAAKARRVYWHITAREFTRYMGNTARGTYVRLRWMFNQFFLYRMVDLFGIPILVGPLTFLLLVPIFWIGGVWVYRRCRVTFWLMIGLVVGNALFIVTYRIFGQAADLTPAMVASAIFLAAGTASLFDENKTPRRRFAVALLIALSISTLFDAPRRGPRKSQDATGFIAGVDLASLPPRSVICSTWRESTALWYAMIVQTRRTDISVINTIPNEWPERIERLDDRPLFAIADLPEVAAYRPTPYREHLWQLHRPVGSQDSHSYRP